MSVDFPEPETPVTTDSRPSGDCDVNIFQVVAGGAENRDRFSVGAAALLRNGDLRVWPERYWPVSDAGFAAISIGRAGCDQVSARFARAGAEIHHVIGAADGFFVVLDDENRVAEVAQGFERVEQAAVVARVQADRRLVKHVEHAAQARADLRGQANALGFAAGKRGGGTVERQVAEADIEKKIDALGDFVESARDRQFCRWRRVSLRANFIHGGARVGERQRGEIGDRKARQFSRRGFRGAGDARCKRRRERATCIA